MAFREPSKLGKGDAVALKARELLGPGGDHVVGPKAPGALPGALGVPLEGVEDHGEGGGTAAGDVGLVRVVAAERKVRLDRALGHGRLEELAAGGRVERDQMLWQGPLEDARFLLLRELGQFRGRLGEESPSRSNERKHLFLSFGIFTKTGVSLVIANFLSVLSYICLCADVLIC